MSTPEGFPGHVNSLGYRIDAERREELDAFAVEMPVGLPDAMSEPLGREIESVFRTENQGSIGSCQGCMCAALAELCYWIASGNPDPIQLSKWAAYRWSQMVDRINGDRGSTLAGGRQVLMNTGLPLESLCPYPSRYTSQINPLGDMTDRQLRDAASQFKLRSIVRIRNSQEADEFLNKGLGGIGVGCAWSNSFSPPVVRSYRPGGGGHAWAILCRDQSIRDHNLAGFRMQNSWGENWTNSDRGWKTLTATALDQIIADRYSVVYGYSDMAVDEIDTRPFDWVNEGAAAILEKRKRGE